MRITDVNIDSRPRNRNPVTENEDKITLVVPNSIDETRRLEIDKEEAKPSSVQQVTNDQYGEPLSVQDGKDDIQDDQPELDGTDGDEQEESDVTDESDVIEDNDADINEDSDVTEDKEDKEDDEPVQEPVQTPEEPYDGRKEQTPEPAQEPGPAPEQETQTESVSEAEPSNGRNYNSPIDRIRDSMSILPAMWRVTYQQASAMTQEMRQERMEKRRLRREQMSKRAEERRQQRMEHSNDKPERPRKKIGGFGALFTFNGKGRRNASDKPADGNKPPAKRMTAKERAMERKREKYELILNGKLLDPDAYKYKSIWKNMVKDGYVEYRRMEYVIGIDRYRIDCSIIQHEDLPLGQHHVTGAKYTYAYDVNGVSFSSTKNNNFTAVSQYNYMHNRVFDDAMSYKWYNQRGGKKSNFLFYVIGVIVFGVGFGLYFVFMR